MKFSIALLLCVTPALISWVSDASAQNNPGRAGTAIVQGKCANLTVSGKKERNCQSKLGSVTLADGTVQFIVSTQDKMISFAGDGHNVSGNNHSMKLPVTFVSISENGSRPSVVPARGVCHSGDPFSGRPVKIDCTAKTSFGNLSFSFLTNGQPPAVR